MAADTGQIWSIYEIEHLRTGRRYVGMTGRTIEQRFASHFSWGKWGNPRSEFDRLKRDEGMEAFRISLLATAPGRKRAEMLENMLIVQRGALAPGGFNRRGVIVVDGGAPLPVPGVPERHFVAVRLLTDVFEKLTALENARGDSRQEVLEELIERALDALPDSAFENQNDNVELFL